MEVGEKNQRPRCKQRGINLVALQSSGVFDPRGSRQISAQVRLLGSLLAGIKQDKKHPGVLIELRKSTAIWDIAYFVGDKVITMDDLEGFSEDLIDAVRLILSR